MATGVIHPLAGCFFCPTSRVHYTLPFPTPTLVPTNTPFVPPADGILFEDNFDSGDLSAWTQNSGQWLVSDGRLTKLVDEDTGTDYQWISLDRPEWRNYILSIDVNKSLSSNNIVIAVRTNTSKPQLIGLNVNHGNYINLVLISDSWIDNFVISESVDVDIPDESNVNIHLEMQGDTYILRANDREVQRITLPGYESGGISIGVLCDNENYGCTTFDNVKVTYLP